MSGGPGDYANERADVIALLPRPVARVLDVGCGAGGTAPACAPRARARSSAFGAGVLWHLLRKRRRYEVFSLLAAGVAWPLHRFRLVVDWHELWSRSSWREYLGALGGRIGWTVPARCLRVPQRAFCFARPARRGGTRPASGARSRCSSEYAGPLTPRPPLPADPVVVFAGATPREASSGGRPCR